MIQRVRKQFICITMIVFTIVLLVPLTAVNVITEAMSYHQTRDILEQIAVSEAAILEEAPGGRMPMEPPDEPGGTWDTGATGTETTPTTSVTSSTSSTTTQTTAKTERASSSTISAANSQPAATSPGIVSRETVTSRTQPRTNPTTKTTAKTTHTERTTRSTQSTRSTRATQLPANTTATELPPIGPYPDWPDDDDWPEPWEHDWEYEYDGLACMQPVCGIRMVCAAAQAAIEQTSAKSPDNQKNIPPLRDKKAHNVTIDHFLCFTDNTGTLTEISGTENYTLSDGQTMVNYVIDSGEADGYYHDLQFYRKDLSEGMLIVFSDRSADKLLLKKLFAVTVLIFVCMEGVALVLTLLLTKRTMKPMQDSFERQRQFISDAGHELKTPLTIISANVDILQDEIGQNKWLLYIRSQTERMGTLIKDMMNLTKLDMGQQKLEFTEFSLSTAVANAVLPFESQAFEQEKKLTMHIQENISYTGNLEQIKQLVAIFTDNAIKYSSDHGEIQVTLEQSREKKTLKIYNTGQGVTDEEKEKIFERFYRSDSSRSRATGGYGLGLSIAKSIAEAHKIKIQVESEYEHWICFILSF